MTRAREMEHDPNPGQVEQVIFRLEESESAYSAEINERAIMLLQTRFHNEWVARLNAEESARVAEEHLVDLRKDLAYCRKWNARMVLGAALLIGVIVRLVMR